MTTTSHRPIALGYVRVSTDRQEIGPEVQIATLEAEAAVKGWDLRIFREDAASGKSMNRRPVLAAALAELKAGRADILMVAKLDRLSRSAADFATMLETSKRQRWALVALDLAVDTSTTTGTLMAHIVSAFAQAERSRISERISESMAKIKADTGKHMGRPRVLAPETEERVRAMHAAGESMNAIARTLNGEGVATATGGRWYASTVRQILTRPLIAAA